LWRARSRVAYIKPTCYHSKTRWFLMQ
jgi:hypothetical protein